MMADCNLIKAPGAYGSDDFLSGTAIVPASIGCWYPPSVQDNDMLQVNFNRREVKEDGLYLVELVRDGRVEWRGCRRFAVRPSGLQLDISGEGEWMDASCAGALRIIGH